MPFSAFHRLAYIVHVLLIMRGVGQVYYETRMDHVDVGFRRNTVADSLSRDEGMADKHYGRP